MACYRFRHLTGRFFRNEAVSRAGNKKAARRFSGFGAVAWAGDTQGSAPLDFAWAGDFTVRDLGQV